MTDRLVTALVPPVQARATTSAPPPTPTNPPPLATLVRRDTLQYGMGRIDASGRVSDKSLLRALGWRPGQRLGVTAVEQAVVVFPDPAGVFAVSHTHYVVLPAPVRRRCGFRPGDRVLLAADPDHRVLVVHPTVALDRMLIAYHTSLAGGKER
ncbi:AbrB/MazE/SpoVT family DNA-binding domain-containing protein [Amycolatopsis cihanbeyliensis]|nr:AbrB/MazE/SpoVT family DNA-binding domain-containing protein [Amycolatopsis cihanbeyliensis]